METYNYKLLFMFLLLVVCIAPFTQADFPTTTSIYPINPIIDGEIRCSVTFPTDSFAYNLSRITYAFYKNGALMRNFAQSDTTQCTSCDVSDVLTCTARLESGTNSRTVASNQVIVASRPPKGDVVLVPEYPVEGRPIECKAENFLDPDGDIVSFKYAWYQRNGHGNSWYGPVHNTSILPAGRAGAGDEWKCVVTFIDNHNASSISESLGYVHSIQNLPNVISGARNREAQLKWIVNYGKISATPEQVGAYRMDQLGSPMMMRRGQYFISFNQSCVGGSCGHTIMGLLSDNQWAWIYFETDFYAITENPQDNLAGVRGSYPDLFPGLIPSILGYDLYPHVNCLSNQRDGNANESCRVTYVVQKNSSTDADHGISAYGFNSGGAGNLNDVGNNFITTTLNFSDPFAGECSAYSNFKLLPENITTTEGDQVYYLGFGFNDNTGFWTDVTHLMQVASAYPLILSYDQTYAWVLHADTSSLNIPQKSNAGEIVVSASFCGMGDTAVIKVLPNTCSLINVLEVTPEIHQDLVGALSELQVVDPNGEPVTNSNREIGRDVVTFDSSNPNRFTFNLCDPVVDACGSHILVDVNHYSCVEPIKRTVAARPILDICSLQRTCENLTSLRWTSTRLNEIFGTYAEFNITTIAQRIATKLESELSVLKTQPYNHNAGNYVSIFDLFCSQATPPAFCSSSYVAFEVDSYRNAIDTSNDAVINAIDLKLVNELLKEPSLVAYFNALPGNPATSQFTALFQSCLTNPDDRVSRVGGCLRCVYNGVDYAEETLLDVTGDGYAEKCLGGAWRVEETARLPECVLSTHAECSEAGSTYATGKLYLPSPEKLGWWCAYNQTRNNFSWIRGSTRGLYQDEVQSVSTTEFCGDTYDSTCSEFNNFVMTAPGIYDLTRYIENPESGDSFRVRNNAQNKDRFDAACFGSLNVTVYAEGVPKPDANVSVLFNYGTGSQNTLYQNNVTNADGHVLFTPVPATNYLITATAPGCVGNSVLRLLNYKTVFNQSIAIDCDPSCPEPTKPADCQLLTTGESKTIFGQGFGVDHLCPPSYDPTNAACNPSTCTVQGCEPIVASGTPDCAGENLVIQRRPVIDGQGNQLIMVIVTCDSK